MAPIGKIENFDPTLEDWPTYVERLELYFDANGIDGNDKKRACLLTLMGPRTYGLLRSLLSPARPSERPYDDIIGVLTNHLMPKRKVIGERFRFYKRDQLSGETINDYVVEIRRLTEHCNFGNMLDQMLRDRFVCGLYNEHIQEDLLVEEDDITFNNAVGKAVAKETAAKDKSELQKRSVPVHKMPYDARPKVPHAPTVEKSCYRCGAKGHQPWDCYFRDATCHKCQKKGHIQTVCQADLTGKRSGNGKSSGKFRNRRIHEVHHAQDDDHSDSEFDLQVAHLGIHAVNSNEAIWVTPTVNGEPLEMELDTGSAVTVISKEHYMKNFEYLKLNVTHIRLQTYTGEKIIPLGILDVTVEINKQKKELQLYVIERGGAPLFGRDWLRELKLDWRTINKIHAVPEKPATLQEIEEKVKSLLELYPEVFQDGVGTLKDIKARITLDENVAPKFCRSRQVPYALKPKVEAELDRLESDGIITKVDWSEWATPIVPVPKQSGSVRICGDFKITVHPVLKAEEYPLPRIEDIFASVAGGTRFSVIDLAQAYHQMELDEDSRPILTINTQKGLYQYNRLVFGIKSAPSIWQKAIDRVLQGLEGTQCYLDDILITGSTQEAHFKNLENVLSRLRKFGLRANKMKCKFSSPLSHIWDTSWIVMA